MGRLPAAQHHRDLVALVNPPLPPKWWSAIERRIFTIASLWLPITLGIFLALCFIGALVAHATIAKSAAGAG